MRRTFRTKHLFILVFAIAVVMAVFPALAAAVDVANQTELFTAVTNAGTTPTTINVTTDIPIDAALIIPVGADITLTAPVGVDNAVYRVATAGPTVIVNGKLTLDGARITKGDIAGRGVAVNSGGMFHLKSGTIDQNTTTNEDGAGIFNMGTTLITGGTIQYNDAQGASGGGISNVGTLTIEGGVISGNSATYVGGGIDHWSGTLTITGGTIEYNEAENGGGISNYATMTENGGLITHNTAIERGGGIYSATTLTLNNASVTYNKAKNGGGIYFDNSGATFTFNGDTFGANEATERGGGMYGNAELVTVAGGSVVDNTAGEYGGGIYMTDVRWFEDGSSEQLFGGKLVLSAELVAGNSATGLAPTLGYGGGVFSAVSVEVINTVVEDNEGNKGGGLYISDNVQATGLISNSTFENNTARADGGAIWIRYEELASLTVEASALFADNRATGPYDRNPVDDATYAAHIFATTWSAPLTQGYNNWDISYTQGEAVPRFSVTFAPGAHGAFTGVIYIDVLRNSATPTPPTPTPAAGWKFAGWSPALAPTVTGNVVYTAQWTKIETMPPTGDGMALWAPMLFTLMGCVCISSLTRKKR